MKKYEKKESDNIGKKIADIFSLKSKGLSNTKISKMIGIPVHVIETHFETQRKHKQLSGIF